jgi:polyhydroxyalkanoate synthesis regulator protein
VVPRYLEQTMSTIARQQEQMRDAMKTTMGTLLPPGLEEMRRQNVAMMERAMSLFTPFYRPTDAEVSEAGPAPSVTDELEALKREVEDLRAQLAARPELRPLRKA